VRTFKTALSASGSGGDGKKKRKKGAAPDPNEPGLDPAEAIRQGKSLNSEA
jgi:hypothetical protein